MVGSVLIPWMSVKKPTAPKDAEVANGANAPDVDSIEVEKVPTEKSLKDHGQPILGKDGQPEEAISEQTRPSDLKVPPKDEASTEESHITVSETKKSSVH